MINYGETIGTSLTFSTKRAMICEFLMANIPNSCPMLDWPVSIELNNFWSTGHCGVRSVGLSSMKASWKICELITAF